MLQVPSQQDVAPDHLHLGGVDQPPQGGLQEGLQLVQEAVAAEDYLFR